MVRSRKPDRIPEIRSYDALGPSGASRLRISRIRTKPVRRRSPSPKEVRSELLGIAPTGRRVRWDAIEVYRVRDGKINEEWAADDLTAILHAVGEYKAPWIV
jgi:SnoaL-like polyketide cyclase